MLSSNFAAPRVNLTCADQFRLSPAGDEAASLSLSADTFLFLCHLCHRFPEISLSSCDRSGILWSARFQQDERG